MTSNDLSECCTVLNFQQMYDNVYEELAKTGIATKLEQPAWFNQEGSIVQLEEEAFGLKSQYKLLHPDKFIIVDEVGSNTM